MWYSDNGVFILIINHHSADEELPYHRDIKEKLRTRKYKRQPIRRVEIPKPDGGIRNLGVPTVVDRFVQQAVAQALTPIFEEQFHNHSYGFRTNRCAQQAVLKALEMMNDGHSWISKSEILNSFWLIYFALFGVHFQSEFSFDIPCYTLHYSLRRLLAYFDSFAKGYKARPHPRAAAKFKAQMKKLTCRSWGAGNDYKVKKLNQLIRGWINYFKIGNMKGLCERLDSYAFGYILPAIGRIRVFHPLETCAAGRTHNNRVGGISLS